MIITTTDVDFTNKIQFLYNDGEPSVKRKGGSFDASMGAYDRVEVWELNGIFICYIKFKESTNQKILGYREMTD